MEIIIREEAGYELALYGMSLSFKDRAIDPEDWWDFNLVHTGLEHHHVGVDERFDRRYRMSKTCEANAGRGKGHDKFLRQICLWVDVEASLEFWKQLDTYKVGTVAQSESTMHVLNKRAIKGTDLDLSNDDWDYLVDQDCEVLLHEYLAMVSKLPSRLKSKLNLLGYKQRRLVTMNYGVLHTIIGQRAKHRLPEWQQFIKAIYDQAEHPELLPDAS